VGSSKALQILGVSGDALGWQIANAGDVNKDGFDDIIIGAPGTSYTYGKVYVIYGKADFSFSNIHLSSLDPTTGFKIRGAVVGDGFGSSVAGAGDVNGDGFADLVIGAPKKLLNQGGVYVIYGKANLANIELPWLSSSLSLSVGFLITGDSY